jgi:hypothetical protein
LFRLENNDGGEAPILKALSHLYTESFLLLSLAISTN